MYTIRFGKITNPDGQGIPAYGLIDNRDGSPLGTLNNFNDGSGHWDIAPWTGIDPLVVFSNTTLKCVGAGFNISQTQHSDPALRPQGVTFDPLTGELNVALPFVEA